MMRADMRAATLWRGPLWFQELGMPAPEVQRK